MAFKTPNHQLLFMTIQGPNRNLPVQQDAVKCLVKVLSETSNDFF